MDEVYRSVTHDQGCSPVDEAAYPPMIHDQGRHLASRDSQPRHTARIRNWKDTQGSRVAAGDPGMRQGKNGGTGIDRGGTYSLGSSLAMLIGLEGSRGHKNHVKVIYNNMNKITHAATRE